MVKRKEAADRVPKEDVLHRIGGLQRLMREAHIGSVLLFQNVDRYYFSGTMQKGVLAISPGQEPLLLVERGAERAQAETPLSITPVKNDKEIRQILESKGFLKGRVGLELDVLPVNLFERVKQLLGLGRYADITPAVKEVRMVKSPFEIAQIKKSGEMVSHVFSRAKDVVREGVTELEIDAVLVAEGRKLGHQGFLRMRGINQEIATITVQAGLAGTIPTCLDAPIAGMGVTPAMPFGSSFKAVKKGIPVTVDYGGGYNGYVTDETRVFVAGKMKKLFEKLYETARAIVEDVISFAKEGVDCTEIYSRALKLARKARLQDYFMGYGEGQVSFIGHGLGLEINELPVITARHGRILKEGMVFAFEPKFVLPGEGAIGLEVDLIVRPRGLERVTADSLDIVYV
jgi:Xaa-Pro dipeptidase